MWDGCRDVLKKGLNSLHRTVEFPDTTLTTDKKLKEVRIMSVHKQLEYNKGLFVCRVLSNDIYIYVCTHTHPPSRYSNSRNYHLSLPRPRMDKFKTSLVFFCIFLWKSLPLTIIQILSFTQLLQPKLCVHLEAITQAGL